MTNEEYQRALAELLSPYSQLDGRPQATTGSGERYVEIKSHRDVPAEVFFLTLDAAYNAWRLNFLEYMDGKSSIIWRVRPEMDYRGQYYMPTWEQPAPVEPSLRPFMRYQIYARLYVS